VVRADVAAFGVLWPPIHAKLPILRPARHVGRGIPPWTHMDRTP
jgi:hypothetical protein